MQIDTEKIRHVILVKMDDGKPVAAIPFRELIVDPDLVTGFVTAVVVFARSPVRTIRKAAYDILIQVGASYLVCCVLDPIPDETPYRERMSKVLDFAENFSLASADPSLVHEIASQISSRNPYWMHYHLLQSLLSSLDLSWMGFLDGNPNEHLDFILPRLEQLNGHEEIQDYVTKKILEQIDTGGTTIGADIDRMIQHMDFTLRAEKIIEQRQREIQRAEIVVDGNSVNLKNFLLTAYGFRLLQGGYNSGVNCDLSTFNRIKHELGKEGITLKTNTYSTQNGLAGVSMGLSNYIWTISKVNPNVISSLPSKLVQSLIKSIIIHPRDRERIFQHYI